MLSTKQLQNNNFQIGYLGESIALEYLKSKGFIILACNLSWRKLEIDILAKTLPATSQEHILVCIEVKTRIHTVHNKSTQIPTYTAYSFQKHRALKTIIRQIIKQYKWTGPIRFDLITVDLKLTNVSQSEQPQIASKDITHYKHVMY